MINNIKSQIFDQLYGNIEDENIVTEIYDNVEELHKQCIDEMRTLKNDIQNKLDEYDKKLNKLDDERKNSYKAHKIVYLVRQTMNVLFPNMYNKYAEHLNNINYDELARSTQFMKRTEIVHKDNGCKFALAVYHGKISVENFSKDLCKYYITLNDKFHPKIKPINNTIENIKELKLLMQENTNICECLETPINVVEELIEKLNNNKNIYSCK